MSLASTESFFAFGTTLAANTFDSAGAAARNAAAANLRRAGYQIYTQDQSANQKSGGFALRADPVNADRVALVHSNGSTVNGALSGFTVTAAIRRTFPVTGDVLVGGFSVYVPSEYVKPTNSTADVICMRLNCSHAADATWQDVDISAGGPVREVFRITAGLLIKWGTDAYQSTKALQTGRVNYIEYRISDFDVKVWMDDTLVMQKNIPLNPETLALVFESNAVSEPGTPMAGLPGRWAIGNWYNLYEDAIYPNVRLGASTRVIGARPSADVVAQFTRPPAIASNAAVAAQNIVDAANDTLQGTIAGQQDIYSVAADPATIGALRVHAVSVKALAANLESAAHTVQPIIRSGLGNEAVLEPHPRGFRRLSAITSAILNAAAVRPTDNRIFVVGAGQITLISAANAAADSLLTISQNLASAVNWNDIAFKPDGTGVIVCSDGKIGYLAPNSTVPVIVTPSPGGTANTTVLNAIVYVPTTGIFLIGSGAGFVLYSSTPELAASWTKVTAGLPLTALLAMTVRPSDGMVIATTTTSGGVIFTSVGGITGWTQRTSGVASGSVKGLTNNGDFFFTQARIFHGAGEMKRSADGIAWTSTSTYMNSNGSTVGTGISLVSKIIADPVSKRVLVLGALDMVIINFGNVARRLTSVVASNMKGGCVLPNGDFFVVGEAGSMMAWTPQALDKPLPSLSGYRMHVNVSAINPDTGLEWTPAEAAATQFGLRLTS